MAGHLGSQITIMIMSNDPIPLPKCMPAVPVQCTVHESLNDNHFIDCDHSLIAWYCNAAS